MSALDRLRAELAEVEKRAPIFRVGRIQGDELRLLLAVTEAAQEEEECAPELRHQAKVKKLHALNALTSDRAESLAAHQQSDPSPTASAEQGAA